MTNTVLDESIFLAVSAGITRFTSILAHLGRSGVEHDYRSADRALQRLRKQGRIEYRNGWRVTGKGSK